MRLLKEHLDRDDLPERSVPEPIPLDRFAATADLREAIVAWRAWLNDKRRVSPHTLAAWSRQPVAFLDFFYDRFDSRRRPNLQTGQFG